MDIESQKSYNVSKEDLVELLDRCEMVLKYHNLAEKLLPTMTGFFFGPTEYDDYYFHNIEDVADDLRSILIPEFDKLSKDELIKFDISY